MGPGELCVVWLCPVEEVEKGEESLELFESVPSITFLALPPPFFFAWILSAIGIYTPEPC